MNANYSEFPEKKARAAPTGKANADQPKSASAVPINFTGPTYAKLPGSPSPFSVNKSAPKVKIYRADQHVADSGNWIAGAIKKPGALHRELGVPLDEPTPAAKLAKAAQAGGKLGQRARLAQTLKKFH